MPLDNVYCYDFVTKNPKKLSWRPDEVISLFYMYDCIMV